jgi:cytochrome P450
MLDVEMRTLTMDVIGRVLLGTELAAEARSVGMAVSRLQAGAMASVLLSIAGSAKLTRRLAAYVIPGAGQAASTLEALVARIIDSRLDAPHSGQSDLLDLLLGAAKDEQPFSRKEIRDEVMTLVLAGHETTAYTLTWALILLSRYPAVRDRLIAEVTELSCGRELTAEVADRLDWTRAVVSETMRLYPPVWTLARDAVVADNIAGVAVAPGDTVAISPYLLHRNSEVWTNPEGFDPRRFHPAHASKMPRYAFIPFGGGRRICVGAGLAQLEATLVLATLIQSVQLDLLPGDSTRPRADVTMHPDGPVPMTVRALNPRPGNSSSWI